MSEAGSDSFDVDGHIIVATGAGEALAEAYRCDVLVEDDLRTVCSDVVVRWGAPFGLLNGAGENHPDGTVKGNHLDPDSVGAPDAA